MITNCLKENLDTTQGTTRNTVQANRKAESLALYASLRYLDDEMKNRDLDASKSSQITRLIANSKVPKLKKNSEFTGYLSTLGVTGSV